MLIAKNVDSVNPLEIYINSSKTIEIPADGQLDLEEYCTSYEIANSRVCYHIDAGDIILHDGIRWLDRLSAIRRAYDVSDAEEKRDQSGKLRVHQTSRKLGLRTMWVGVGDDQADPHAVGGGESFAMSFIADATNPVTKYIDFNCVDNETWFHEGYLVWEGCRLDTITADMVTRIASVEASSGTDYDLYGGYLIIPAASGTGTINVTSDITTHSGGLIYMPDNDLGESPVAYWNADWNTTTELYENIVPAPDGNGRYNMFATEITLARFVNEMILLGDGFMVLSSSDTDQMGHGMRLKLTATPNISVAGHEWTVACTVCLHRESSI